MCGLGVEQMSGSLVASDWRGLASTTWSEETGGQVLASRMLNRLASEDWARDLLGQLYLDVETQAWADNVDAITAIAKACLWRSVTMLC